MSDNLSAVLPILDPATAYLLTHRPDDGWRLAEVDLDTAATVGLVVGDGQPVGRAYDWYADRAAKRIDATLHLSPRGKLPEPVRQLAVDLLAGVWAASAALGVEDDVWRTCAAHLPSACLDVAAVIDRRLKLDVELDSM